MFSTPTNRIHTCLYLSWNKSLDNSDYWKLCSHAVLIAISGLESMNPNKHTFVYIHKFTTSVYRSGHQQQNIVIPESFRYFTNDFMKFTCIHWSAKMNLLKIDPAWGNRKRLTSRDPAKLGSPALCSVECKQLRLTAQSLLHMASLEFAGCFPHSTQIRNLLSGWYFWAA